MTGRPAVAIGCAEGGERLYAHEGRVAVPWAEVRLLCAWRAPIAALRGAIVAALGPGCHVDYHGHLGDGVTRQTRATVLYREGPRIWCCGPRAVERAAELAAITSLVYGSGDGAPVDEARVTSGLVYAGLHREEWYRYVTATGYYPGGATLRRRPRGKASPEQRAWAGHALASSIRSWLADVGLEVSTNRPVHVQVEDYRTVPVRWRDDPAERGFVARFVSNAILPDGVGLGQHVSEGWGEVRRC